MNYMGIDYHKQYSHITLMDEKGKKLKSGRVANYRTELLMGGKRSRPLLNLAAQAILYYVSAMTAFKNRVYALHAEQREEVRDALRREANIFSGKGQKVLLGLNLALGEKRLLEALLKMYFISISFFWLQQIIPHFPDKYIFVWWEIKSTNIRLVSKPKKIRFITLMNT